MKIKWLLIWFIKVHLLVSAQISFSPSILFKLKCFLLWKILYGFSPPLLCLKWRIWREYWGLFAAQAVLLAAVLFFQPMLLCLSSWAPPKSGLTDRLGHCVEFFGWLVYCWLSCIFSCCDSSVTILHCSNWWVAVGINAAYMQTYIAGVSCPIVCNKHNLDHGVLLVGYGKHGFAPLRLSYKPYWIIKNSWGPMWGDHGYYKICRGHGECGLNTMVSAVAAVGVATDTA